MCRRLCLCGLGSVCVWWEQVEQVARLLAAAKKPVLVVGSQATLPPVPPLKLQEVVEQLNIPCFLAGMARGAVEPAARGSPASRASTGGVMRVLQGCLDESITCS